MIWVGGPKTELTVRSQFGWKLVGLGGVISDVPHISWSLRLCGQRCLNFLELSIGGGSLTRQFSSAIPPRLWVLVQPVRQVRITTLAIHICHYLVTLHDLVFFFHRVNSPNLSSALRSQEPTPQAAPVDSDENLSRYHRRIYSRRDCDGAV